MTAEDEEDNSKDASLSEETKQENEMHKKNEDDYDLTSLHIIDDDITTKKPISSVVPKSNQSIVSTIATPTIRLDDDEDELWCCCRILPDFLVRFVTFILQLDLREEANKEGTTESLKRRKGSTMEQHLRSTNWDIP